MTKNDLKKLKIALPIGYIKELATDTGFSRGYISLVINGERKNLSIIDKAIKLAKKAKAIQNARTIEIKNL